MPTLIGTDEAGYGPNLGPLMITATRWTVTDSAVDLYDRLRDAVSRDSHPDRLTIADSKQLYSPGAGIAALETNVLAALRSVNCIPETWRELWRMLVPVAAEYFVEVPWYADYDCRLPVSADPNEVSRITDRFSSALTEHAISLDSVRPTAVFPARFNKLLDRHDSKGAALSIDTLELVARELADSDDNDVLVQCDKHGGRNRYLALLQTVFPDTFPQVVKEGRAESIYRLQIESRRVEFRFVAKGESFLPAALASMVSKYMRELAMQAFNAFWQQHLPDLKPTAGYPVDAKRFRRDIADVSQQLGVPDRVLWRER